MTEFRKKMGIARKSYTKWGKLTKEESKAKRRFLRKHFIRGENINWIKIRLGLMKY